MQRIQRYLGSFLLGATLVAPMVLAAGPKPQEERREEAREHQQRYYDRDHKDYHVWDNRENGAYQRWQDERHDQSHRDFARLKRKQQSEYWRWRHEHPDNDGDRH
jgi:uncharacterized protein YecT (DUF1311 family)